MRAIYCRPCVHYLLAAHKSVDHYCRTDEIAQDRAKDANGDPFMTVEELIRQEQQRRAGNCLKYKQD